MLAGKYFYSFTVKQRWWISSSWTSMILAGLSGMFMAWDQEGRGGLSKGKVGPWAHCWGMMKQDCRSQSGCSNPGIQQPVQQCPSSVPGVQWMLSIIPFHLWSVVELSPPPGCLGCVPWDSSVCADFNMQLAESGRLSADWEIILPRFTLWYILFWGTEQKTFNRVWLLGKPLWCHKCWHTSFRLSVIPQAMLCILPGGAWCTVLERGVKRKKRMDENIWDPILCSGISFGMTEVAADLFSQPGYFCFQISHVDCCVFLNWFFYLLCPNELLECSLPVLVCVNHLPVTSILLI